MGNDEGVVVCVYSVLGSTCSFHKDSTSSLGFSVRSAKVIIIGAPGVGKTSLVLR